MNEERKQSNFKAVENYFDEVSRRISNHAPGDIFLKDAKDNPGFTSGEKSLVRILIDELKKNEGSRRDFKRLLEG